MERRIVAAVYDRRAAAKDFRPSYLVAHRENLTAHSEKNRDALSKNKPFPLVSIPPLSKGASPRYT
jgi:hypothetical protein